MPFLDDDRVHLFIIVLLIPLQFFIWNYIHAFQPDVEPMLRPSIYFKSNPFYLFDYLKNGTTRILRHAINSISLAKVSLTKIMELISLFPYFP